LIQYSIFKKGSFIGLFLFIITFQLLNAEKALVTEIEIDGNVKTLDYILRREIQHDISVPLDSQRVEDDIRRLKNLGLFSSVNWNIIPLNSQSSKLIYSVTESIQNLPPAIVPSYDEKTGWSLIGSQLWTNWKGKNQIVALKGSIGGKYTYGITFNDPWKFGNHVSMNMQAEKLMFKHNFLGYDITRYFFKTDFGRWYGEQIKTKIGFLFNLETLENQIKDNNLGFNYISIIPALAYDTRDIYWAPSKGIYWSNNLNYNFDLYNYNFYNFLWKSSFSYFTELFKSNKKAIFGFNMTYSLINGKYDVPWYISIGDAYSIRGWQIPRNDLYDSKNEDFRFGYNYIHSSIEFRKEVIPKFVTDFGVESGLSYVLFIDSGLITDEGLKQPKMYGGGIGIRIPFPVINLLRIDYGWGYRNGEWNKGSLHWGVLHKF